MSPNIKASVEIFPGFHFSPVCLFVFLVIAVSCYGQSNSHPGINLYVGGKYKEAIISLSLATKDKTYQNDPEIWTCLGLSYIRVNDNKNARKALENAVKISPDSSVYHSNLAYAYLLVRQMKKAEDESTKAIKLDSKNATAYNLRGTAFLFESKPGAAISDAEQIILLNKQDPQGYLLKSNALTMKLGQKVSGGRNVKQEIALLEDAKSTLETGLVAVDSSSRNAIEPELESVRAFYDYFSKPDFPVIDTNAAPEPGVTSLKITEKSRPNYTDEARSGNVQGTITLAVLFRADGKPGNILLLKRLGSGLDQQAMIAARKIKFEPMKKDGQPISVVKVVEYSFSIY